MERNMPRRKELQQQQQEQQLLLLLWLPQVRVVSDLGKGGRGRREGINELTLVMRQRTNAAAAARHNNNDAIINDVIGLMRPFITFLRYLFLRKGGLPCLTSSI